MHLPRKILRNRYKYLEKRYVNLMLYVDKKILKIDISIFSLTFYSFIILYEEKQEKEIKHFSQFLSKYWVLYWIIVFKVQLYRLFKSWITLTLLLSTQRNRFWALFTTACYNFLSRKTFTPKFFKRFKYIFESIFSKFMQ